MSYGSRFISGLKKGLLGAGAGAVIGAPLAGIGAVPAAIAGGLGGFGFGFLTDEEGARQDLANQTQQNSAELQQSIANMKRNQYDLRMQNLDKAMQYFGPVDDAFARAYGTRPTNPNFFTPPPPPEPAAPPPPAPVAPIFQDPTTWTSNRPPGAIAQNRDKYLRNKKFD